MSEPLTLHGSVFAYHGAGCLLLGPSGSGKSTLVADALLFGAKFVADDQVTLSLLSGLVAASAVSNLAGVLELPGYGLMRVADFNQKQVVHLVVELGAAETERIPKAQKTSYLGVELPFIRLPAVPRTTVSGILHYLRAMQENRMLPADWMPKP